MGFCWDTEPFNNQEIYRVLSYQVMIFQWKISIILAHVSCPAITSHIFCCSWQCPLKGWLISPNFDSTVEDNPLNWECLTADINAFPTFIIEVACLPPPSVWKDTYYDKDGMGCVIIDMKKMAVLILWHHKLLENIQFHWVRYVNPWGDIANYYNKLCEVIVGHFIFAKSMDICDCNITTFCYNHPYIAWLLKGSVSQQNPILHLRSLLSLNHHLHYFVSPVTQVLKSACKCENRSSTPSICSIILIRFIIRRIHFLRRMRHKPHTSPSNMFNIMYGCVTRWMVPVT